MSVQNRRGRPGEKALYEMLNEVQYDFRDEEHVNVELGKRQRRRIAADLRKRTEGYGPKIFRWTAALAAALVILVGAFSLVPVYAETWPVVGPVIQMLNERFGQYRNYADYAQMVNKEITSNGLSLTINDVLCDDVTLMFTFTIKSEENLREKVDGGPATLFLTGNARINGKRPGDSSSTGTFLDDHTFTGVDVIALDPFKKPPTKLRIGITARELFGIEGVWDLAFTATREQISKDIVVFAPKQKVTLGNDTVTVDKIHFTPLHTSLVVTGKCQGPYGDEPAFEYDHWFLFDDAGNYLKPVGWNRHGARGQFRQVFYLEPPCVIPEYLTVVPARFTPFEESGEAPRETVNLTGDYPLVLEQGEFGILVVEDVIFEPEKTVVTFRVEGVVPAFQGDALGIVDGDGEYLEPLGPLENLLGGRFRREFEALNPGEDYSFVTTTFDDYKLNVDETFVIKLK